MKSCGFWSCNKSLFRVRTNHTHAFESYSCGIHVTYHCSLCNDRILRRGSDSGAPEHVYIQWHFMSSHTFKKSARNYLYPSQPGHVLINEIYYKFGQIDGNRFCHMVDVIKSNPHFIYLVPEFSFSDILDQFDEDRVSDWSLLAAVRNKPFSCLMCGGRFESFPSNEVFAAHKCKK